MLLIPTNHLTEVGDAFCKARRLTWARPFSTNVFLMQVRLVCTLGFLSRRVLFRQQYPRLMMGKLGVCSGPPL